MTTSNDLITRAGRALGYLGRTETLKAGDANDGLTALNALLDSWSTEELMSYVTLQRSFPMVVGQQSYTIGESGSPNINTARPYDIVSAFIRDNNNNDYPMRIIPRDIWDNIGEKGITSQIPDTLFYASDFPNGTIYIFPVPLLAYTVVYNATTNQVVFTDLFQTLSMPAGYERGFVMNLALELMNVGFPFLLDEKAFAMLIQNASEAKGNIKRRNLKEVIAEYDPAIVSRSQATYNIYSDSSPRSS